MKLRFAVDNELSKIDLDSDLRDVITDLSQTDIPRLREGRVGGQFWSVYVGCSSQYLDAVQYALEQIDLVKNMVRQYPDTFNFARSTRGMITARNLQPGHD